nr:DNA-directed DNA polymerase [Tanacetum cinerariifolium]
AASRHRQYHFTYPKRRLTMEEMLYKFIDEGKQEHKEMRAFICEFQTTNEILFKERNNSLCELRDTNTSYSVKERTSRLDGVKSGHLYSASANKIDEKRPNLKSLPNHLEYAYLQGDKAFRIIISSKLSKKEKKLLLQVLETREGAIAWKMSDIKGISLSFCTHKILMEDDFKPVIQPQRCINLKVQDVVKNEIAKLLDSGLIYPISDSSAGFFQIPIAPEDQENKTFTCPYGTFAYRRMPFELCNAPVTFQRCMTTIFHDMVEDFMEVFMDDFSVFGHKISEAVIEVDRAKIDVIAKFPYQTNVKGVRSFLGHVGFYRRFIKEFSMISKPMTKLLMKDTKFDFFDDCKKAFNISKERLTTMPIIISSDWNVPFELICDASDFTIGAVLGQ